MNRDRLIQILNRYKDGEIDVDDVIETLIYLPYEDIRFANIDHHRELRRGMPEVVYGQGKTIEQIVAILDSFQGSTSNNIIVTKVKEDVAQGIQRQIPELIYHKDARILVLKHKDPPITGKGYILVVSAGTSDLPIAMEAVITAKYMGNHVQTLFDVGVAGLHRIIEKSRLSLLRNARVIIVVAGMEGALPSVIAGLVDIPVIAVPTSIGYGASFQGLSALLAMLNSCASGVVVVNIDNGFGAAYAASQINNLP